MKKRVKEFENFIWVDVENPSEEDLISLDLPFKIDNYFLEDSLTAGHLPKLERVNDYIFMILRAYTAGDDLKAIEVGQLSNKLAFFIHEKGLLTIHRAPVAFLMDKTEDWESVDALVLDIIDDLLLTFDQPIKNQADKMDQLESFIFLKGGDNLSVENLYFEKAKARLAKKILFLMQQAINQFKVSENLTTTLQDIKDTLVDMLLRSEEIIEDANALLNSYMSFTAKKSNDVMKLLTIFSAFFLPLTFIVGVYGMNFDNMPELRWENGYFFILGIMVVISLLIFIWFKRKKIM
jgi:magnesium transporter